VDAAREQISLDIRGAIRAAIDAAPAAAPVATDDARLIERLRAEAEFWDRHALTDETQLHNILIEAADAIAQLRAERDRITHDRDAKFSRMWQRGRECETAEARERALREALGSIKRGDRNFGNRRPGLTVSQFAAEALAAPDAGSRPPDERR
jgi:Ni/Co efflux regulator RcnB